MAKCQSGYLEGICFSLLLSFTSISHANLSFEIGPSYIINMSKNILNNGGGLNFSLNYELTDKISINPRISLYKFVSPENYRSYSPRPLDMQNPFYSLSPGDDEYGFIDLSVAIKIGSTDRFINPIFTFRSGIHSVRYSKRIYSYVTPSDQMTAGPYYTQKIQKTTGFAAFGFGLLFNMSRQFNFIIESSYSTSFYYNYNFVPIDLTLRITL
jgi:hypothetical protein